MTDSGTRKPAAELVRESDLDSDAIRVVARLVKANYEAYLVGGCVRDLLIGKKPKDFDLATSANPRQIRNLFSNSRVIGRRFRLVHVSFGDKIIEVSTFRKSPESSGEDGDHLITRDNIFGSAQEDALRRDFTINALFYDPERKEIVDHVGGLPDIEARVIRTIGDPDVRIQEDPVRIIRAARLKAQIRFTLESSLLGSMKTYADHIRKSAPPRVQEEIFKILESGASCEAMQVLIDVGCFAYIYPSLASEEGKADGDELPEPPSPVDDEPGELEERILDWDARVEGEEEPMELEEAGTAPPREPEKSTTAPQPDPPKQGQGMSARLAALDEVVVAMGRPPRAVLLSVLILDRVRSSADQRDVFRSVWSFLGSFRENNRVSRKDAELCSQIIAFQRRLFGDQQGRRPRRTPEQVLRLRYFPLALALADIDTRARGEGREIVEKWTEQMRAEGMDPLAVYKKKGAPAGRSGGRDRKAASGSGRGRRGGRGGQRRGGAPMSGGGDRRPVRNGRGPSRREGPIERQPSWRDDPGGSSPSWREEPEMSTPTWREGPGMQEPSRGQIRQGRKPPLRDDRGGRGPSGGGGSGPSRLDSRGGQGPSPRGGSGGPPRRGPEERHGEDRSQARPERPSSSGEKPRSGPPSSSGEKPRSGPPSSSGEKPRSGPPPRSTDGSGPRERSQERSGPPSGDRPAPVFKVIRASKEEETPKKKTHRARGWIRMTKRGQRPKRKRVARKRV